MSSLIRFDRLSCGIPACIQTSDESKLLSISVWINAGSARDPVDKGGLAHLCEHGGFKLLHDRAWYVTDDSPHALVLRRLDRGGYPVGC